jgi:predicted permease
MHLILRLIPIDMLESMPYLQSIGLKPRVLTFAALVAVLAVVLFSLTPTLRLSLTSLRADLADGGRSSAGTVWRRFGSHLVVLELAIAVVLLAGAGLIGRSFYHLLHVQMGFAPDHLAAVGVEVPGKTYAKPEQQVQLVRRLLATLRALPGVESAAITTRLPVGGNGDTTWIRIAGRPWNGEHNEVNERDVSADFFATIKAHLISGRFFTDSEDSTKPQVIVINEALAKRYFPGEDPIGKVIGPTDLNPKSLRQIVGVVDDIREGGLDEEIWPAVYYPYNQDPDNYFDVVLRTSQAEQFMLPELVATIHKVDPDIGTRDPFTMTEIITSTPAAYIHRSAAWLVGGFAVLALILGVVGLYGVIAYSVSQRTREIGVRMALGAQRSSVYQLILREAGLLTALGVSAGLVCAIAAATFMGKLLFGVRSWDLPTLIGVALLLSVSALVASFIPARRAASVNPVEALRAE